MKSLITRWKVFKKLQYTAFIAKIDEATIESLLKNSVKLHQVEQIELINLFEALVGAVFLDRGYNASERFIFDRVIDPHVDLNQLEGKVISYKSLMVEWCQKEKKKIYYVRCQDEGVDEVKHFSVLLKIDGKVIAKARATSRKKAEEKASQRGYFALQDKIQL